MSADVSIYRQVGEIASGGLRQCEIISGLIQHHVDLTTLASASRGLLAKMHPYSVLLTQDCDLSQDFTDRQAGNVSNRIVPNLLFCEAYTAEEARNLEGVNGAVWKIIIRNKDPRYQFLSGTDRSSDLEKAGIPELTVDFKRYFTIPTDEVYAQIAAKIALRRTCFASPYVEHLSDRYAHYLGRIGLPSDHRSE